MSDWWPLTWEDSGDARRARIPGGWLVQVNSAPAGFPVFQIADSAGPEAPAGLPDGIHHYQSPEPGDPYHGYDGGPATGWWIDVYEDGSVAVTGRAPASAFAPCVADAQRRGWGGQ